MELSEKQSCQLNTEIYLYMIGKDYVKSAQMFKKEGNVLDKMIVSCVDVLSTKWKSVITLQEKMSDLSLKIFKLEEQIAYHRRQENSQTKMSKMSLKNNTTPNNMAVEIKGEHKLTGHHGAVLSATFHPYLPHLATGSQDNYIKIWDALVGEEIHSMLAHKDGVTCVNYDSQGKKLVSSSIDLCIKVWNAEKQYQQIIVLYGHQHTVSYVNFMLGDNYVISSSRDCRIKLWDTQNGAVKRQFLGHTGWVRKLAITKDYVHFVSCSGDQSVNVWMLEKQKPISSFKVVGDVIENIIIIEKQHSDQILHSKYISIKAKNEVIRSKQKENSNEKINLKSNFIIVICGRDTKIRMFSKNGSPLYVFSAHQSWIRAIVLHPEGRYLFSGADDQNIIIWDLKTGIKMQQKKCHQHFILNLAIHRKYQILVSVSSDCSIRLWNFLRSHQNE